MTMTMMMMLTMTVMMIMMVTMTMIPPGRAAVFSSMMKLQQLAKVEDGLLQWADMKGGALGDDLIRFVETRQNLRRAHDHVMFHPNAGYLLIKAFVEVWTVLAENEPALETLVDDSQTELPNDDDIQGTLLALLRLQSVYNLSAWRMYTGNYSGYTGPALSPDDALYLGAEALYNKKVPQSETWLKLAKGQMELVEGLAASPAYLGEGWIIGKQDLLCLLGRVYVWQKDRPRARELLEEASKLSDKPNPIKDALEEELAERMEDDSSSGPIDDDEPEDDTIRHLCCRDRASAVGKLRPTHTCRYKPSFLVPFLCYKEEILSLSPYVSLFHDVISDTEIEALKRINKLEQPVVYLSPEDTMHTRTGQVHWVSDWESEVAARLSKRISGVIWLDVNDATGVSQSAEALQIVNYGLGGHYSLHFDAFGPQTKLDHTVFRDLDDRVATFLMYLSDTDIGGHTIFPGVNISVAPMKGMALFWYNLKPSGMDEPLTRHAACPVLRGDKWIANKWIWETANMFRRPCGPQLTSTHLEVEPVMYNRRRHQALASPKP